MQTASKILVQFVLVLSFSCSVFLGGFLFTMVYWSFHGVGFQRLWPNLAATGWHVMMLSLEYPLHDSLCSLLCIFLWFAIDTAQTVGPGPRVVTGSWQKHFLHIPCQCSALPTPVQAIPSQKPTFPWTIKTRNRASVFAAPVFSFACTACS